MTLMQLETQIIAVIVSMACVIPGIFLVLKRQAMMSDAISHSILLGIVIAFIFTKDLASPFLILGAGLSGLGVVVIIQILKKTRLLKEDSSIGLVFPLFFSVAVVLISVKFANVHIDVDAVLLGEIAFAPLDRLRVFATDIGPKSIYSNGAVLIINTLFLILLFKELKLSTFDADLSYALGFSPVLLNYLLMADVSITVVTAFDAVGSVLVVALIIAPPAAGYLITEDLKYTIIWSLIFSVISALAGYWLARFLDVNIAGMMASIAGLLFAFVLIFAPDKGIISKILKRNALKTRFYETLMIVHISHHIKSIDYEEECDAKNIHTHLGWDRETTDKSIKGLTKKGLITKDEGILYLTNQGKEYAIESMLEDNFLKTKPAG